MKKAIKKSPSVHLIDAGKNIFIQGNSSVDGAKFSVRCHGELMKNQVAASPVAANKELLLVRDEIDQPMIFSIGADDGGFHLIRAKDGCKTGWETLELSKGLAAGRSVKTFDLRQDLTGAISVGCIMNEDAGNRSVHIAANVGNGSSTDWSQLMAIAKPVTGLAADFQPEKIRLGSGGNGQSPLAIVEGSDSIKSYYYHVDTTTMKARRGDFPETPDKFRALEPGFLFGKAGTLFLYGLGDSQTLTFETLPGDGVQRHVDLSPGENSLSADLRYTCIATSHGTNTATSDVYAGTRDGIVVFPGMSGHKMQLLGKGIGAVRQVTVREDDKNIAIWAMMANQRLYYIPGSKPGPDSAYVWDNPVLFSLDALHVAPMRRQKKRANELFVLSNNLKLAHHWQDPQTTSWLEGEIAIPHEKAIVEFDSFTTSIQFRDENGLPVAGKVVEMAASDWAYTTVNGLVYSLDMDSDFRPKVKTDLNGSITIISRAKDIASPTYHLYPEFTDQKLNVYPNSKLHDGLAAVEDGSDLKDKGKGTADIDGDTLDRVAGYLGQMTDVTAGMMQDSGEAAPSSVFSNSMKFKVPGTIGDALKGLENTFTSLEGKLEKEGLKLKGDALFLLGKTPAGGLLMEIRDLQGTLITLELNTLMHAFKGINWLLKLIGIDLSFLLKWLGFFFEWEDVWETHKVISALLRNGLSFAKEQLSIHAETWKRDIGNAMDSISDQFKALVIPPEQRGKSLKSEGGKLRAKRPDVNFDGVSINWLRYQISHGGLLLGSGIPISGNQEESKFETELLAPAIEAFASDIENDLQAFAKLFSDSSHSVENLFSLLNALIDTVVDPMKAVVDGAFELLPGLLNEISKMLHSSIEIPFLGSLLKKVAQFIGVDLNFDFIDAISFIVAIPYTDIYKVAEGKAPFAESKYGLTDKDLFDKLFSSIPSRVPMTTISAAASSTKGMSKYSQYGVGIASVASLAANILNFFNFADSEDSKADPLIPKGGKDKMSIYKKVAIGLSLLGDVCTIPMPLPGQNPAAYGLRWTAYGLSGIYDLSSWKIKSSERGGGYLMGMDFLVLLFSLTANGIQDKEDWWSWVIDTGSNVGGMIQGGGIVSETSEAIVAGIGVSGLSGSLVALIHAWEADGKVIQHVNIGG